MLRLVILGVWAIAVTAAATYGSILLRQMPEAAEADEAADLGVEELKTEMTSVPVIRGGDVMGYVIIQMSFQADRRLLEKLHVDPMPYLTDAAFRVIFADDSLDFGRMRGSDLDRLTNEIVKASNARIGDGLIRHVLIQQLNLVRKEDIRTNWIKTQGTASGHSE